MTTKNQRSFDPKRNAESFHISGTSYHSSKLKDILRQQQEVQMNLNSMSF